MPNRLITGNLDINVLLAFIFGVVFVSVMVGFAAFFTDPSPFAQWVFVIVTALAGAGVGAVIPGILKLSLPHVKAGGALAVFVLVLANKPGLVSRVAKFTPPEEPPLPVAIAYLQLVDKKALGQAWSTLDSSAQETVARDRGAYKFSYENGRDPLGNVSARVPMGTQEVTSPPGFPLGIYRSIAFRTTFSSGVCHSEQVVLRSAEERHWRVFEHAVSPTPIPCL
jgi:hypothetical protein